MHPIHKLGNANTIATYHEYHQNLIKNGAANGAASNAYLTATYVPDKSGASLIKYRTGALHNQEHAIWFVRSTSLNYYSICPQLSSTLHFSLGANLQKMRVNCIKAKLSM
jgi:hypothetical protein